MSHLMVRLVALWFALLMSGQVFATTGNRCSGVSAKSFKETPAIYLHEALPAKAFGKRWSTSSELTRYFDQQRKLLAELKEQMPPADAGVSVKFAATGDLRPAQGSHKTKLNEVLVEHLDTLDIVTANLATPIAPASQWLAGFKASSRQNYFSLLSTANDELYGADERELGHTLKALRGEIIWQSGLRESQRQKPYLMLEKQGVRIGFYALSTFAGSDNGFSSLIPNPLLKGIEPEPFNQWLPGCELDLTQVKRVLHMMDKDGADIKIVSIHWGLEHDMYPQPIQMDVARQIVHAGADVIIGSNPQVIQPAEVCFVNGYEDTLDADLARAQRDRGCVLETGDGKPRKSIVYYSLGNLIANTDSFWQQVGVLAELTFTKSENDQGSSTDWYAPNYAFTYDSFDAGIHHLNLLNNYIVRGCESTKCSGPTKMMVGTLNRHLTGASLSWWEQIRISAITTFDTLKTRFIGPFLASKKPE